MNNLIEVLKEQESFGFTGKINLLSHDSGQFLGVVYLQDGVIVGASFKDLKNHKALIKMIFDDVESIHDFKFVVEPEVIGQDVVVINYSVDQLLKEVQGMYEAYQASKKLKPPANLRLVVDPYIIISQDDLSTVEFELLATITEYSKVSEIYKKSNLLEYEITNALVSLRKKKAIKVYK